MDSCICFYRLSCSFNIPGVTKRGACKKQIEPAAAFSPVFQPPVPCQNRLAGAGWPMTECVSVRQRVPGGMGSVDTATYSFD